MEINEGDLYIVQSTTGPVAHKNNCPGRTEFRMKTGYMFTIVEKNISNEADYIRVLMSNTGKLQLLNRNVFNLYLEANHIKKIG